MKQSREAEGLTLRKLALETQITTPVIKALEPADDQPTAAESRSAQQSEP